MSVRYGQRAASAIAVEAGTDLRSVLSIVFGIPRLQPWGKCQPDLTGLAADASHRLEIVDQTGHAVWQGAFRAGASRDPGPGTQRKLYFVRVYLPAGGLRREYGLEIH